MNRAVAPSSITGFLLVGAVLLIPNNAKAQTNQNYEQVYDIFYSTSTNARLGYNTTTPEIVCERLRVIYGSFTLYKSAFIVTKNGTPDKGLYSTLRDSSKNILATSNTLAVADINSSATWKYFTFPSPYTLANATTYYLCLDSTHTESTSNYYWFYYAQSNHINSTSDYYAYNQNGSWNDDNTSYDLAFMMIYINPTPTIAPTSTPSNNYDSFDIATASADDIGEVFEQNYTFLILILLSLAFVIGVKIYNK